MLTVLFICTENLFRSASSELLLTKLLDDKQDDSINVLSAGTKATDRWGLYSQTKERLLFYGVNFESYYQKKLTQEMIDKSDVIICMTKNHQNFVKQNFGVDSFLFNELAYGVKSDLEDDDEAYGTYSSLEHFVVKTVDTIANGMEQLYKKVKSHNIKNNR
ncbi:hypothetical protein JXA48_00950 [Candidatus Woesearchaeota archaeon]|nr:hypothetical protein [Candidatus Woesearchaeota archaeon]